MRCLVFTLYNGDRYGLPLEEIAKKRAAYYAAKDPETTFQQELEYVMRDNFEGIDWFCNNHDPEDFAGKFFLISPGRPTTLFDRIREADQIHIEELKTMGEKSE